MPDEASSVIPAEILLQSAQDKNEYSVSPSTDAACETALETLKLGNSGLTARQERGWGPKFEAPVKGADDHRRFKRLCDDLYEETLLLLKYLSDENAEEADGFVAEIMELLERLYDCQFGEGECLKASVVAIQSQLSNADWTETHVKFLLAVLSFLRVRWVVDDQTVNEIDAMIEEFGLDPFRGTVSDTDIVDQYRLVKVERS